MVGAPPALLLFLASWAKLVGGNAILMQPPARNSIAGDQNAYCPQCGNGNGTCGDGGQWPASSNYLDTYGPVTILRAGSVVPVQVDVRVNHMGHFEISVCDQQLNSSVADPQTCLNRTILKRQRPELVNSNCTVDDSRDDCQPYLDSQPERWYLSPGNGLHTMHFIVPEVLVCDRCTLQWRYWTGNSCEPAPGYGCFFDNLSSLGWAKALWCGYYCGTCPSGGSTTPFEPACGEQFRNCADVTILPAVTATTTSSFVATITATTTTSTIIITATTTRTTSTITVTTTTTRTTTICVRNPDCAFNSTCNDAGYDTWCPTSGLASGLGQASCREVKRQGLTWLSPTTMKPFQATCNPTQFGGGWMLVYNSLGNNFPDEESYNTPVTQSKPSKMSSAAINNFTNCTRVSCKAYEIWVQSDVYGHRHHSLLLTTEPFYLSRNMVPVKIKHDCDFDGIYETTRIWKAQTLDAAECSASWIRDWGLGEVGACTEYGVIVQWYSNNPMEMAPAEERLGVQSAPIGPDGEDWYIHGATMSVWVRRSS